MYLGLDWASGTGFALVGLLLSACWCQNGQQNAPTVSGVHLMCQTR